MLLYNLVGEIVSSTEANNMWLKKGRIIYTNAQLPVVEVLNDDYFNIYFSERNPYTNESSIWSQTFLISTMSSLTNKRLVLSSGESGMFDDCGVMPSCVFKDCDGSVCMYYTGWSRSEKVPYRHAIGLIRKKGDNWFRDKSPLISQDRLDSYLCNSAFVYKGHVYYCSGTGWDDRFPTYDISARSFLRSNLISNEIKWKIVDNFGDQAISRPFVMRWCDKTLIFYSYRTKNESYKIGVAVEWNGVYQPSVRVDSGEYVLSKSAEVGAWDSEMVCYPYIVELKGVKHMFYNGNNYGETGIGYATWAD